MMKTDNGEKRITLSIRMQIVLTFFALLILLILGCIIMNSLFLEKYYVTKRHSDIKRAYEMLNTAFDKGDFDSDEMEIEIQRLCATYNISMFVMDEATDAVLISGSESELLENQLLDNFFGTTNKIWNDSTDGDLLEKTNTYTVRIQSDNRTGDQYIEMWGVFDNGNIFLIRSAIDSISESVSITNRFLIYVGLALAVFSAVAAILASSRISKPLLELAGISEKMKTLDFNAKYSGESANEIGVLGNNINELSEILEKTISELKTANNELTKDLDRREEIDKMRTEFLSNVSHELKTPISLVQGYAEGLKECVNDDSESRDFYCDVIMDEAGKMNTLVKKLLSLNQIEFGNDIITFDRFDIVSMIENYLQSADILIRQNDANIKFDKYSPIYVWGDEYKAEEVFSNYFSNALNHLEGERIIEIRILKLDDEKTVRISVFNTGEPIPEEAIPHLWDKFFKVDKARSREYGGSGIGLSIVKAIQESINQKYGVLNHENGVEFFFELDTSNI